MSIATHGGSVEPNASRSASSAVYREVKRDILNNELEARSKLQIEALSSRYGVGASPLREALNRLSAEGLVIQQDQKGFRVAPVSQDDLHELTRARLVLDEALLRESINTGDAAWEEALVVAYHRLSRVPNVLPGDATRINPAWHAPHKQFHRALLAGVGSPTLLDFSDTMFDRANRYRALSKRSSTSRDVMAEHKGLMEAALDRAPEEATRLLQDHVNRTTELVVRQLVRQDAA